MSQSLSKIWLHIVFNTKNRQGSIRPEMQEELWRYLAATCNASGCHARRVGGTVDHVHILCELARTIPVCDVLEKAKKSSSKWMKTKGVPEFGWQNGYGAFSIGQSQVRDVVDYICGQGEHHRRRTFQEEYIEFLKKYEIDYDPQYVWD